MNKKVTKKGQIMVMHGFKNWVRLAGILLVLFVFPSAAFSQVRYDFELIARTGETIIDPNPAGGGNLGPITGLGRGPSINDSGKVAFIAGAGSDVRIFLKSDTAIDKNYIIFSWQAVSDDMQVNNNDQISFRFLDNWPGAQTLGDTTVIRLDTVTGSSPVIAQTGQGVAKAATITGLGWGRPLKRMTR